MPQLKMQLSFLFFVLFFSCSNQDSNPTNLISVEEHEKEFVATMQKHLDAVSNKDLATLKSTLAPNGKLQLILPKAEITNSVEEFIDYHQEWFQDSTWTFETKILNTKIGDKLGIAITEVIYREPERNGKPYFNRMNVSYALEKIGEEWYIIKDHASSIEKTEN